MDENTGVTTNQIGERLAYGQKPFDQLEVQYTITASNYAQRCESCRFFNHGRNYDPCYLVPNNEPFPITVGGHCNQWLEMKVPEGFYISLEFDDDEIVGMAMDPGLKEDQETMQLPFIDMKLESGFKVVNDKYWIAWYSNNFRDKEGEAFSEASIDNYNAKTASGEWELPELWMFHDEALKHGKALKTFRIGHFQMAVGMFDDPGENPIVQPLVNYYKSNPVTMSHGYFWDPKKYSDKTYHWHRTFEISTLQPGREANPYFTTLQEVGSMAEKNKRLTGEDRKFVEGILGKDLLAQMEGSSKKAGKLLESLKVDFKKKPPKDDDKEDDEDMEDEEKSLLDSLDDGQFASFIFNAKIAESTISAVEEAHEGIKLAANAFSQNDERLGEIETKVERLSQLVLALVQPNAGSKSKITDASGEADVEAIIAANDKQKDKGGKRQKSLVEQLAMYAGDDADTYDKSE